MLPSTKTAITAVLNADPSIDKNQVKAAVSVLESKSNAKAYDTPDRILRRPEVARLLGVSVKRIDQLALRGLLRRITIPGTSRAIGYSEESIRAITEPKGGAA